VSVFIALFHKLRQRSEDIESIQRISITMIDRLEYRSASYNQLCNAWQTVCNFMDLNGFFTIGEKIEYIASSIYLMKHFDTWLNRPTKLINTIQQLSITQTPDIRGRA